MKTGIDEIIEGVKNGRQEDYEKLRRKYSPLISKEVFGFSQSGAGSESELRDEAERALLNAALSFDSEKGIGFGYYAKICVRNALITVRRSVLSKEKKKARKVVQLKKRRTTSFAAFEGLNPEEIIEKIESVLSSYEKKVFMMSLEGKRAEDIAAVVNKDAKSVHNAIFRARSKVKNIK